MRYLILIMAVLSFACHEQNKNKISPAELVKSREIKKVSEAELLKGGTVLAEQMVSQLDALVEKRLQEDSIDCEASTWPEIDSLAKSFNSQIRLVGLGSEQLKPLEYQLLEAYQYNLENDLDMVPSVQKLDERTVLYTYPVSQRKWVQCTDSLSQISPRIWSMKMSIKEIIQRL